MKKTTYAILANPVSGKTGKDEKILILQTAATILRAKVHGLDTESAKDFQRCALNLATQCDVIVVAGGDGTFSAAINTLDTDAVTIAYLPLGSGNALRYALGYQGSHADIAMRIQKGPVRKYDLINCDQKKCDQKKRAFMVSIGMEGMILSLRDQFLQQGKTGFYPYLKAVLFALFKAYTPCRANVAFDSESLTINKLMSCMIMKQPYYGYGMKVIPKAVFDDRLLHVLGCDFSYRNIIMAGLTAFSIGNRVGQYRSCKNLSVNLTKPLIAQIDGDVAWEAKAFHFEVLPGALRIKC